jgi:hypothetical protein
MTSAVGTAAAKAAGIWALMYLILGSILAFWKWSSGAPPHHDVSKANNNNMLTTPEGIMSLTNTFPSKQLRHAAWIEAMEKLLPALVEMEESINDEHNFVIPKPWKSGIKKPSSLKDLEALLKVQDLSTLSDKDLLAKFQRTRTSVIKNIEQNYTLQWEPLVDLFLQQNSKFPKRTHRSATKDFQCPTLESIAAAASSSSSSSNDLQQQVEAKYAKRSDIQSAANAVVKMIQGRRRGGATGLEALMPQTRETVEKEMFTQIGNIMASLGPEIHALVASYYEEAAISKGEESSSQKAAAASNQQCASKEQLLELIEVGLYEIIYQQGGDLRRVLTRKVREMDPSMNTQELILDADLPLAAPTLPEPETINLAHVIDTPALQALKTVIDKVVDYSGGYSERLDRYLDSVVGEKGVGQAAVSSLLLKASKVNLPHPQKIVQELPPALQKKLSK